MKDRQDPETLDFNTIWNENPTEKTRKQLQGDKKRSTKQSYFANQLVKTNPEKPDDKRKTK